MGFQERLESLKKAGVGLVMEYHLLDREITSQDLSSGALDFTTTIADKWEIEQVLVHSDTGINERITVTFDSLDGANYDTIIGVGNFDGGQDVGLVAGSNMLKIKGESGDEIRVQCSNNNLTGIIYVTIKFKYLA